MLKSYIIEIDGRFVGAAIRLDAGYRFVAVDAHLAGLDGTTWPNLPDVQRLARRVYLTGSFEERIDRGGVGSYRSPMMGYPNPKQLERR
jgi:hypothetical protein